MRLLNTSTLKLQEFFGNQIPAYAILSHRWEGEEVSFQALQDGTGIQMPTYTKITSTCNQAALDGWEYVWIDSCCINKTSSAELSEAINSMFMWYRRAQVCYVYLSDVEFKPYKYPYSTLASESPACWAGFYESKWFSRGWTLQELLAPMNVVFFDRSWSDIGTKNSLRSLLTQATGIQDFDNFEHASVAQKMSWVSRRETTRVEDMAYCLLGLFGVNMPPLYGEGTKAFLRLQLEIINITSDESIFAWKTTSHVDSFRYQGGLLADSPAQFFSCEDIVRGDLSQRSTDLIMRGDLRPHYTIDNLRPRGMSSGRDPYSMTNQGLRMEHFLLVQSIEENRIRPYSSKRVLSLLDCKRKDSYLAIDLWHQHDKDNEVWWDESEDTSQAPQIKSVLRLSPGRVFEIPSTELGPLRRRTLLIQQSNQRSEIQQQRASKIPADFSVIVDPAMLEVYDTPEEYCSHDFERPSNEGDDSMRWVLQSDGTIYAILFKRKSGTPLYFAVFIVLEKSPWTRIMELPNDFHFEQTSESELQEALRPLPKTDRASKLLLSGESVSVSIKVAKGALRRNFVVEIELDPDGQLTWPQQS